MDCGSLDALTSSSRESIRPTIAERQVCVLSASRSRAEIISLSMFTEKVRLSTRDSVFFLPLGKDIGRVDDFGSECGKVDLDSRFCVVVFFNAEVEDLRVVVPKVAPRHAVQKKLNKVVRIGSCDVRNVLTQFYRGLFLRFPVREKQANTARHG